MYTPNGPYIYVQGGVVQQILLYLILVHIIRIIQVIVYYTRYVIRY